MLLHYLNNSSKYNQIYSSKVFFFFLYKNDQNYDFVIKFLLKKMLKIIEIRFSFLFFYYYSYLFFIYVLGWADWMIIVIALVIFFDQIIYKIEKGIDKI